jgi:integrase
MGGAARTGRSLGWPRAPGRRRRPPLRYAAPVHLDGLVFTSPRGIRLYPPAITRTFHDLTDRAGVPRVRLHDLRHTHATLLLKSGEMTKVVTERLGHSTTAYTQDAYQHVLPGMQRDAARRFRERMNRLDDPPTHEIDEETAS